MRGGRRIGWAVGVIALGALVAGCTPPSVEPSPTPIGFASEEEAFAAAEATYRAYVDALNGSRGVDAEANEEFLSGQALADEQAAFAALKEAARYIDGDVKVVSFKGDWWTDDQVNSLVCLDQSDVSIRDSSGADMTPATRSDSGLLEVRFRTTDDAFTIIESVLRAESC